MLALIRRIIQENNLHESHHIPRNSQHGTRLFAKYNKPHYFHKEDCYMKYKLHIKQNNESEVDRQVNSQNKQKFVHDIVGLHFCSFLEYFSIGFS